MLYCTYIICCTYLMTFCSTTDLVGLDFGPSAGWNIFPSLLVVGPFLFFAAYGSFECEGYGSNVPAFIPPIWWKKKKEESFIHKFVSALSDGINLFRRGARLKWFDIWKFWVSLLCRTYWPIRLIRIYIKICFRMKIEFESASFQHSFMGKQFFL